MTSDSPKVLIVDDDTAVLGALQAVLSTKFQVTALSSGEEAVRTLRIHGPFQVVMSDMRMPVMNGVEFLRKATEVDPWAVKILLTGFADTESAMRAVNEGHIFKYLTKPCPPRQLLAAFDEAVARYQRAEAQRRNVIGDKERISRRMVRTQGLALLGRFVEGTASELDALVDRHRELIDGAVSTAQSGGFVSVEDLEELRAVETALREILGQLDAFDSDGSSREDIAALELARCAIARVRWLQRDDIEIVKKCEAAVPDVNVVPSLLEQALTNLLENALEAVTTQPGTGTIGVEISYEVDTDTVLCTIWDTGPGIHKEVAPFAMRPFFTTNGPERAGLGLPVAQSVIESFGGTLDFECPTGGGARFHVRLPAAVTAADTMSNR